MPHKSLARRLGLPSLLLIAGAAQAATFTVANNNDSGTGSLRQAISDAATTADGPHTIRFAPEVASITLASQLTITSALTIDGDHDGNGTPDVTLSGNNATRVMAVDGNLGGVVLNGLVLTQGLTNGRGAGLLIAAQSSVTLRHAVVSDNVSSGPGGNPGGGGVNCTGCTVDIVATTVRGNSSTGFGGGVRGDAATSVVRIVGSTIVGNRTTSSGGGGVHSIGTLEIINSTVSGNAATSGGASGGGIRVAGGTSTMVNTTIVGNAAGSTGGGILASAADTFINVVVAGNRGGSVAAMPGANGSALGSGGSASDVGGVIESSTNSFYGTSVTITSSTNNLTNQGTTALLLGTLADNGGRQPTHVPQATSALIDAGACATDAATDQRGIARPQGTACDIGAVELVVTSQPLSVTVSGPGSVSAGSGITDCTPYSGTCSATYADGTSSFVTLTATPRADQLFTGWGGACTGQASTCQVVVDQARTVTAAFAAAPATGSTDGGDVSVSLPGASCGLSNVAFGALAGSPPAGQRFPYGQVGLRASDCAAGETVTIALTFPEPIPAGARLIKYTGGAWVDWPASISGNTLTYTVTDGDPGDDNPAPGIVDDPVALAVPLPVNGSNVAAIPTLSQWGLIVLALLMAIAAWRTGQRRA